MDSFHPLSAGTDFRRHNLNRTSLDSKDGPRAEKNKLFIMTVDPA